MRVLVALLALCTLMACGTTAPPTATLVPPTATPAFARYSPLQVVRAFQAAGLVAGEPVPMADSVLRGHPYGGQGFTFLWDEADKIPSGHLIALQDAESVGGWKRYLDDYNRNQIFADRYLIHGNIILVFTYSHVLAPPDLTLYFAVFAGIP